MNKKQLGTLVDDLGQLKAEIAILKSAEAAIRTKLIGAGITVMEGDLFRANVIDSITKVVDWKTIAGKLEPSRQMLLAHTSQRAGISIRVTSRVGATS